MAPRKRPFVPARRPASADGPSPWLYGVHPVLAALANPQRRMRRLLATPEALRAHEAALAGRAQGAAREEIERLLPPGAVHQGLALLAEPLPETAIEDVLAAPAADAVLVLLDQVTDPHNVGAVLRSAAAFGAVAVVLPKDHAPPVTGTLAKSASGALELVPLVQVTNLARTIDQVKEAGFWTMGLDERAGAGLAGAHERGRAAIALGAEGSGLRRLTRERCDVLVRLPTRAAFASLNVSNAAAVALYELARTRPT